MSLAFSAFIELGQLTGLFFMFRGSCRLCDVDDLMLNTLGGLLGGELVHALEAYPQDLLAQYPNITGYIDKPDYLTTCRMMVVMSSSRLRPWKPATTTTRLRFSSLSIRSVSSRVMRAEL